MIFEVSPFKGARIHILTQCLYPNRIPPLGRLVRLIPNHEEDPEMGALKQLFELRLDNDPKQARMEWLDIVEARHLHWTYISSSKMELIRSVLNTLNLEIVKRARKTSEYNFAQASIGNMFLTG